MKRAHALGEPNGTASSKSEAFMDIYDLNHIYGISLKKLRRMEKDGVLRTGKSQLPKYWQMVRSDIHKSKLSARSIALAYQYPRDLEKMINLSRRHRSLIDDYIRKIDLPKMAPPPVETEIRVSTVVFAAVSEGGIWLDRFIAILQSHIPEKAVNYHYVAVRILLMCGNPHNIDLASEVLRQAILKARDHPSMAGWWSTQATQNEKEYPTIFRRPTAAFDL